MLIFLNILLIFLVQTSFLSMVIENVGNLILAKCFVYNYHWKKSSETYISICCVTYIYFLFYNERFWSKKKKSFSLVLKSAIMFCDHYFLPQVKNIGSIKRYFHIFPFQDCFVFHLMLFLKGFLVLSDLLNLASDKGSKEIS